MNLDLRVTDFTLGLLFLRTYEPEIFVDIEIELPKKRNEEGGLIEMDLVILERYSNNWW